MKYNKDELSSSIDNMINEIKFILEMRKNVYSFIPNVKKNEESGIPIAFELAEKLNVSKTAIYKWLKNKNFPARKIYDILIYLNRTEEAFQYINSIKCFDYVFINSNNIRFLTNKLANNKSECNSIYYSKTTEKVNRNFNCSEMEIKMCIEYLDYFRKNSDISDIYLFLKLYHYTIDENYLEMTIVRKAQELFTDYSKAKYYNLSDFTVNYLRNELIKTLG